VSKRVEVETLTAALSPVGEADPAPPLVPPFEEVRKRFSDKHAEQILFLDGGVRGFDTLRKEGVMEVVVAVGAGLDVHKKRIVGCCIDGRSSPPTITKCTFGTFKDELERLRDWLRARECTHVAMESTGVYWMPVYRALEGHVEIVLGNPRHMANVPGRKTDVTDAHWIAKLLRHGLIQKNFVPPQAIRELRQITRYRRKLIHTRTASLLRVEKLLQSANIKLSSVASDIFGVSGRAMLSQLADGVTNPERLADAAKGTLRGKRQSLTRALAGTFSSDDANLLAVQLNVIEALETELDQLESLIAAKARPFDETVALLDTIPGINRTLATDLVAEIGTSMAAWPSDAHFAAWTGTCPGNRESAGIRRPARAREGNPYIKTILIQAAVCAKNTIGSHLSHRYARLAARRGPRRAAVAVAREIAVAVFHMVSKGETYRAPSATPEVIREQRTRHLLRELQKLGYEVQPRP
jgi:transposase